VKTQYCSKKAAPKDGIKYTGRLIHQHKRTMDNSPLQAPSHWSIFPHGWVLLFIRLRGLSSIVSLPFYWQHYFTSIITKGQSINDETVIFVIFNSTIQSCKAAFACMYWNKLSRQKTKQFVESVDNTACKKF